MHPGRRVTATVCRNRSSAQSERYQNRNSHRNSHTNLSGSRKLRQVAEQSVDHLECSQAGKNSAGPGKSLLEPSSSRSAILSECEDSHFYSPSSVNTPLPLRSDLHPSPGSPPASPPAIRWSDRQSSCTGRRSRPAIHGSRAQIDAFPTRRKALRETAPCARLMQPSPAL